MPGFELFGDAERKEVHDVLDSGVLMRYGFDGLRKGHWKARDIESERTNYVEALNKIQEKIDNLVKEKGFQILQLDPKAITNALSRLRDDKKTINNQKVFYDRKDTDLKNEIRKLKKDLVSLSGIQDESIENMHRQ